MAKTRWADLATENDWMPFEVMRGTELIDASMYIDTAIELANQAGAGTRVIRAGVLMAQVAWRVVQRRSYPCYLPEAVECASKCWHS